MNVANFLKRTLGTAFLGAGLLVISATSNGQTQLSPVNVVHLSAFGEVEVEQDLMSVSLAAHEEGKNAAEVQNRLQKRIDHTLKILKQLKSDGLMDLKTSGFSVYPLGNGEKNKQMTWSGSAMLTVEGTDFARITHAINQAPDLQIAHIGFAVSPKAQAQVIQQAQDQAILRFQSKAQALAKSFGFTTYSLREVHVQDGGISPRSFSLNAAMHKGAAVLAEATPMQVEPGKSQVQVQLSGSIQMQ